MGVGIGLFLIAVGGVLAFAVNVPASGIDLEIVGVILMAVGFVTVLFTLIWWSDVMPWRRDRMVIRERHVAPVHHEPPQHAVHRERRIVEYEERAS